MLNIGVDRLSRAEARSKLIKLARNQEFEVHRLKDGRRVFIRTDGKKTSISDGEEAGQFDFTVHYDGETRRISYVDDILVDLIRKEALIGADIKYLLTGMKDSVELLPLNEIMGKYPKLSEFEKSPLIGHTIEFLLVSIRWLGLQEDVNYWGQKKNGGMYEGR